MPVHLQDFLGANPWLLWLAIAPIFLAAEVLQPRRVWVVWAPACVVGSLTAAIVPGWWLLQAGVTAVIGIAAMLWLSPRLRTPDAAHADL